MSTAGDILCVYLHLYPIVRANELFIVKYAFDRETLTYIVK